MFPGFNMNRLLNRDVIKQDSINQPIQSDNTESQPSSPTPEPDIIEDVQSKKTLLTQKA
jgi:hypothetical protein